jgi:DNA-binding FadR family transcriptional regulator
MLVVGDIDDASDPSTLTEAKDAEPALSGLHDRLLHRIGRDVASKALPAGSVMSLGQLTDRYGASRTVVREVVKVLESMRILSSRRRVGITVQPSSQWNVLDPLIIRWRLDGPQRAEQLLALSELRLGVEPVAAALAAHRATPEHCGALTRAVIGMAVAARGLDFEAYLDHDAAFHRTVLIASGNEVLAALAGSLREVLAGRTHHHLMPPAPEAFAVRWHADVAEAIAARDAEAAERVMREIVAESMHTLRGMLAGGTASPPDLEG